MAEFMIFDYLKIPLDEISLCTNKFSDENLIRRTGFGWEYRGQLSHWSMTTVIVNRLDRRHGHGDGEFLTQIVMLSQYKHENLVSLVGFCDEGGEKIVVYKHEKHGYLDNFLGSPDLTWMQRLKISVGVARGLNYLHYGVGTHQRVLHRDIKSANILLDENWKPKITGFELSTFGPANEPITFLVTNACGTVGYIDPVYVKTGILTKESDYYSFGILLFELLCGRKALISYQDNNKSLGPLAMRHYEQKRLDELIDPIIRKQMNQNSLVTFSEIAYQCLNSDREQRPRMGLILKTLEKAFEFQQYPALQGLKGDEVLKAEIKDQADDYYKGDEVLKAEIKDQDDDYQKGEVLKAEIKDQDDDYYKFDELRVELEEIESATNNFSDGNLIGRGGFAKVYRGELALQPLEGSVKPVAVKRIDRSLGQGDPDEFWKEIKFLSMYKHENLASLVGFCADEGEQIIIYEFVERGSLDRYLSDAHLTWSMRLQICLDAARGLSYLHDPQQRVLHCNIKSSNILIDGNWRAKISDFGLSNMVGSIGYVDPLYMESGILTKESDAYAFGVVLLEVLCGRLAITKDENQFIVPWACHHYDNGTIEEIVDPILRGQMKPDSLSTFSSIAFHCLRRDRKERPTMVWVMEKLEQLLKLEEGFKDTFDAQQEDSKRRRKGKGDSHKKDDSEGRRKSESDSHKKDDSERRQEGEDDKKDDSERRGKGDSHKEDDSERRRKDKDDSDKEDDLERRRKGEVDSHKVYKVEQIKIPLDEIRSATCNFDDDFKIKRNGRKTYKAELLHFDIQKYESEKKLQKDLTAELTAYPRTKSTVVIKRLEHKTTDFLKDISILSMSRNQNLLPLVGFCDEEDESIIVYEYASNGSLDEYICRKDKRNSFPWVMRLRYCLDVAHGLNFLHNGSGEHGLHIIHGNIKSSNIFLGRDGVGKIGDFGFSSTFSHEALQPGRLTKDYDVYSFGVVLFEVLTGKMPKDDPDFLPHNVRHCLEQNICTIMDRRLKEEFEKAGVPIREDHENCPDSIKIFADIAYRCTQKKQADRPTMANVVQQLEKAFKAHEDASGRRRKTEDDSPLLEDLKHLKIPFREIYSATHGLDGLYVLGRGGFGAVYRAELFHVDVRNKNESDGYRRRKSKVALKRSETKGQGWKEFMKEIKILSTLNHQNIISLVGFCDEYGEMILVYDFAFKGSFNKHIPYEQGKYNLSWAERLQICIEIAQGLNYLHNQHIIHCDIKSDNILLGENWEGMVGDFGLSKISNANSTVLWTNPVGTPGYIDPKYLKDCILSKQSDMYSFGAMLLEVFSAKLVLPPDKGSNRNYLVDVAKHHFPGKQLYHLIAPFLREELEKSCPNLGDEKFMASINTFVEITHKCLSSTSTEPHQLTMLDVLKELRKALTLHLIGVEVLSLEVINSATNCFSNKNVIGTGASAKVYKGELSLFKGHTVVAVKKFNHWDAYREGEFLKKVAMLSRYVHENITPLRGFCEEGKERIIILELAVNGSLDKHLDNKTLTWGHRLKISIGAAKGLHHIHSFPAAQSITHGDVKSGNILLHHDWKATVSDFILSKGHGTIGYINPQDNSVGLTKKSDVYAFGVVLFEILSGRLAIEKAEKYPQRILNLINTETDAEYDRDNKVVFLARAAVLCFEHKMLEDIIFDGIKNQTDAKSIDIFSEVAYQCLQDDQEKRPTMAEVIEALERIHDEWKCGQKLPKDYNKIINSLEHRVSQSITKKFLHFPFASGILVDKPNVGYRNQQASSSSEKPLPAKMADEDSSSSDVTIKANSSRQGTESIEEFYSRLQRIWSEIEERQPNPMVCPEDINIFNRLRSKYKLHQFLAGVGDEFEAEKRQLLEQEQLPSPQVAYDTIRRARDKRVAMGKSNVDQSNNIRKRFTENNSTDLWSPHCPLVA